MSFECILGWLRSRCLTFRTTRPRPRSSADVRADQRSERARDLTELVTAVSSRSEIPRWAHLQYLDSPDLAAGARGVVRAAGRDREGSRVRGGPRSYQPDRRRVEAAVMTSYRFGQAPESNDGPLALVRRTATCTTRRLRTRGQQHNHGAVGQAPARELRGRCPSKRLNTLANGEPTPPAATAPR